MMVRLLLFYMIVFYVIGLPGNLAYDLLKLLLLNPIPDIPWIYAYIALWNVICCYLIAMVIILFCWCFDPRRRSVWKTLWIISQLLMKLGETNPTYMLYFYHSFAFYCLMFEERAVAEAVWENLFYIAAVMTIDVLHNDPTKWMLALQVASAAIYIIVDPFRIFQVILQRPLRARAANQRRFPPTPLF